MFTLFTEALHSVHLAADRADRMALYGCLIGSWQFDAVVHADDGTSHEGRGEAHAGWVLEGRAIQDVWIPPDVSHGTTLRVYDPGLSARHVLWSDPRRQYYLRQIGRARGPDAPSAAPATTPPLSSILRAIASRPVAVTPRRDRGASTRDRKALGSTRAAGVPGPPGGAGAEVLADTRQGRLWSPA